MNLNETGAMPFGGTKHAARPKALSNQHAGLYRDLAHGAVPSEPAREHQERLAQQQDAPADELA
jgi:hypothetical protein